MSDTASSLIEKIFTLTFKMWNNQELLYEIRRMTFEEYKAKYFETEEGAKLLWDTLKKACDLNVMKTSAQDELDILLVKMIQDGVAGEDLENGKYIQKKFKTY